MTDLKIIEEAFPLQGDFAQDAKYTWPSRWEAVKNDLAHVPEEKPNDILNSIKKEFARRVTLRVAEFPDRTSPEDQPEMMLITPNELRAIVEDEMDREIEQCAPSPLAATKEKS